MRIIFKKNISNPHKLSARGSIYQQQIYQTDLNVNKIHTLIALLCNIHF